MTSAPTTLADGSSPDDAHQTVEINRSKRHERYRWRCPNGHVDFDPTNGHIYCRTCAQAAGHGVEDMQPVHYEIYDAKQEKTVPWSAVKIVENRRWLLLDGLRYLGQFGVGHLPREPRHTAVRQSIVGFILRRAFYKPVFFESFQCPKDRITVRVIPLFLLECESDNARRHRYTDVLQKLHNGMHRVCHPVGSWTHFTRYFLGHTLQVLVRLQLVLWGTIGDAIQHQTISGSDSLTEYSNHPSGMTVRRNELLRTAPERGPVGGCATQP